MKQVGGVWLPSGEVHLLDKTPGDYQGSKRNEAMRWVREWRTAVDVGAHCGLWSMHLVHRFRELHAFEPVLAHRKCFEKNVTQPNAFLYGCALGDDQARVNLEVDPQCTAHGVISGRGDTPLHRLDDFDLQCVDFLKVDCVGYELEVLRGARKTLAECRPCVCVEQKPGYPQRYALPQRGAVDFLIELGARLRAEMSGVYVLSWDA